MLVHVFKIFMAKYICRNGKGRCKGRGGGQGGSTSGPALPTPTTTCRPPPTILCGRVGQPDRGSIHPVLSCGGVSTPIYESPPPPLAYNLREAVPPRDPARCQILKIRFSNQATGAEAGSNTSRSKNSHFLLACLRAAKEFRRLAARH
jgi:hypothetical protein